MNNSNQLANVILFTRGTKGDLYPFLRIGADLKKKACGVTLLSNYCYEEYARQEAIDFVALDNEEIFNKLNNIPEYYSKLPSLLRLYKEHIVVNLERELNLISLKIKQSNTVLVAHSNDYLSPMFAMEKFNVPLYLCVLAPSFIHSFSLFEAVLNSLSSELNQIRRRQGLEPVIDWGAWLRQFTGCFAFWPNWFSAEAAEILPDLEYVGFPSIESIEKELLQDEVARFLEGDFKKILVTHGTSKPFNENYFRLIIEACKGLNCKLVVGTEFRSSLPELLPSNVIWVKYCPFHELLPKIDLIIHHGGIGTTREAIANEVPQLIVGQGFDRQHNGRIIRKLSVGDWISPKALNKKEILEKIEKLFSDCEKIKLLCLNYKSHLHASSELEKFYETIIHEGTGKNYSIHAREAKTVTNFEQSTRSVNVNKLKKINSGHIKVDISAQEPPSCKQQLMLRLLKDKARRDQLRAEG